MGSSDARVVGEYQALCCVILNFVFVCFCRAACGPVCVCGHQDHRKHHDCHDAAAVHVRLYWSPALQSEAEDVYLHTGHIFGKTSEYSEE